MAQLTINKQEAENFFETALCNGPMIMGDSGLSLETVDAEYKAAKAKLKEGGADVCLEDVYMQILRDGGKLLIVDHEGDGEYNAEITMELIHERLPNAPQDTLWEMQNEYDDAATGFTLIQQVAYNKVIF